MKKQTVFSRYFNTCASIILISITFLGVVFLAFASNYFKEDKYRLLTQNLKQAKMLTSYNMTYNILTDQIMLNSSLESFYSVIAKSVEADIYLADTDGKVVLSSVRDDGTGGPTTVPVSIIQALSTTDIYTETGKLGGAYPSAYYTVGVPVLDGNGRMVGAIFASTSATVLTTFLIDMFQMFVISAVVVMLFSFIIIYFITSNMVRPLQEMLNATHSFSNGDFSVRVPVDGDDEVAMLSAAFNAMASSLATLEQTRRSFTANVSHELKTPMTTIGGFIDGILDGTIPPEKHKYYLGIVSSEIQRLSRLVRSMLNISKIEAGELNIAPKSIDITEIAIHTALIFEKQIEDKHLEVRGLDSEKHLVNADPDLIHQVVYNLVDNAVKFVNDGGYLEFSFREEGNKTFIGVRNSGSGITPEETTRVFDRFYKTDKSRSLDKNGVGLGLYIVKTILNLHGGEIFIRSAIGEYTEFVFTLPTINQKKRRGKKPEKDVLALAPSEEKDEEADE